MVITATGIAARFTGHPTVTVPGLVLTGTFTLAMNTGTTAVNEVVDLGDGVTVALVVPAAATGSSFLRFEGVGIELTIAGQRITGDLQIEKGSTNTKIKMANVAAVFGSASTPFVTLSGGSADLTLGTTGIVGDISGTVAVQLPQVDVHGRFTLHIDTVASTKVLRFTASTIPADPVAGTPADPVTISVAGQQLTIATLSLEQQTDPTGARVTKLTLTTAKLALAGVGDITLNGVLLVSPTGVAGQLTAGTNFSLGDAARFSGTLLFRINSGAQAVTVPWDDGVNPATTLTLPAGPYLRIEAQNLDLKIGPSGSETVVLHGSFTVEQATSSTGGKRTVIGASGVSVALNGSTLLRDVQGILVLLPDDPATTTVNEGGLAARLSGTVDLSSLLPANVQVAGSFELTVNQTGARVNETVTVADDSVALDVVAGPYTKVAATGVVLSIAGQTLTGDVSFEQGTTATVLKASNLALSLGGGVVTLENGNGTFTFGTGTPKTMTGNISGTVALHVPGVELSGTLALEVNTATPKVALSGTNVSIVVAGQRIRGDFSFTQSGTGPTQVTSLTIANLKAFFGDDNGTPSDRHRRRTACCSPATAPSSSRRPESRPASAPTSRSSGCRAGSPSAASPTASRSRFS